MHELGGYRELTPSARVVGDILFVGALLITAVLERFQFKLGAEDRSHWWASNGRDVLNAVALAAMAAGLGAIGFAGPISLAIAATIVIFLSILQGALARYPRASIALSMGSALAIGLPIIAAPESVHGLFRGAIEWLFRPGA